MNVLLLRGGEKPIAKLGPNLHCSESGIKAVKWAGFDCVTLANNHFYDFGQGGVIHTLETCNKYGIDIVGGGINLAEASKVWYKQIDGKTLAIINCCEHEFSIASDAHGGSNPLNPIQQYYGIRKAKDNADFVLVIVHGGHEHWQLPSPRMVETYRFFIDAGADAVVNHHQHCYSGHEVYRGKPIFYGLGNFCFDISPTRINSTWNYGYMAELEYNDSCVAHRIIPYKQCDEEPIVELLSPDSFCDTLAELNSVIADSQQLCQKTKEYYSRSINGIRAALSPIGNKYYRGIVARGWFPGFISKNRLLRLENISCCEAHVDKLYFFLNDRLI